MHTLCRAVPFENDQNKRTSEPITTEITESVCPSLQMGFTMLPLPFRKDHSCSFLDSVDQEFWKSLGSSDSESPVVVVNGWLRLEQVSSWHLFF